MRKIFLIAFLFVFAVPLVAQDQVDVTLAWDQDSALDINILEEIRIYDISSGSDVLVATAACSGEAPDVICPNEITFQITEGTSATWIARNYDGISESGNSNQVQYGPPPEPKNLRRR